MRGGSTSQSEQLPCAGSAFSEPHTTSLPAAFRVICPGGTVVYCCDVACLERVLHAQVGAVRGLRAWVGSRVSPRVQTMRFR